MKTLLGAAVALMMLGGAALAAEDVDGTIKSIDRSTLTLTLDNGQKFKLSEEFNFDDYSAGMQVTIQYDNIKGQNIVLQIVGD